MLRNGKMTLLMLGVFSAFILVAGGFVWFLMRRMNPPLPSITIQVASSGAVATGTPTAATAQTPSSTAATTPTIVAGENPPLPTEALGIDNATFTVEVASSILQKMSGLSFRPSLAPDHGMLFLFATGTVQTFWMKDMNFPLDMIWISGTTVVGFSQNAAVPPPGAQLWQLTIYSSPADTDTVLELNAGTVAKYNIKVGDTIRIGPLP